MLKGKGFLDYTNLFSFNEYERHFIALFLVSIENLKILKYHTFWKKH